MYIIKFSGFNWHLHGEKTFLSRTKSHSCHIYVKIQIQHYGKYALHILAESEIHGELIISFCCSGM